MDPSISTWCNIINQLFILELRTRTLEENDFYRRRFDRIKELLNEINIYVHDPLGESYDHTRMDCEGIIQGDTQKQLFIIEVIKPIIYLKSTEGNRLVQPGVVLIEGK